MARPGRPRLATPAAIRREMVEVYLDMRTGKIAVQDGSRLVYALSLAMRAVEVEQLTERIERLEQIITET